MIALALLVTALAGCPHDASLGTVTFARGGHLHVVSLATCADRDLGRLRGHGSGPSFGVVARGRSLWVRRGGRLVRLVGPLPKRDGMYAWPEPISRSPDGRVVAWLYASNSASLGADGSRVEVTSLRTGRTHRLGWMLGYPDYLTWCGSSLVLTAGGDRLATHNKRLIVARAPDWKPRSLWHDAQRVFGSVACAPDGKSVAALSQQAGPPDYNFFHTRWQLWRVGLDGSRHLLDAPPAGWADESPQWSRNGRSLLFARERKGYGGLMLWRAGHVIGPFANLGYSLGYYGHHDWQVTWSA